MKKQYMLKVTASFPKIYLYHKSVLERTIKYVKSNFLKQCAVKYRNGYFRPLTRILHSIYDSPSESLDVSLLCFTSDSLSSSMTLFGH